MSRQAPEPGRDEQQAAASAGGQPTFAWVPCRPGEFTWTTPAGRTYSVGPDTTPL